MELTTHFNVLLADYNKPLDGFNWLYSITEHSETLKLDNETIKIGNTVFVEDKKYLIKDIVLSFNKVIPKSTTNISIVLLVDEV